MTEVNPGKHGLIRLLQIRENRKKMRSRLLTAYDLNYPRVHEIITLSGYHKRIKYAVIGTILNYQINTCKR